MDKLERDIIIRIQEIPFDLFIDVTEKLKKYNVNFYDKSKQFNFNEFRLECQKTMKLLYKRDKPVNGIRYELCDFMSLMLTLVGIKNMNKFIYGNEDNIK